jgi:hypothetical protein
MLQTSYFSSAAPTGRKICIAKIAPDWFQGFRIPEFAPENPWAKGDWRSRYRRELWVRFPCDVSLLTFVQDWERRVPDPILCCYERRAADCHRSVLASFLAERLGLRVTEWCRQARLF